MGKQALACSHKLADRRMSDASRSWRLLGLLSVSVLSLSCRGDAAAQCVAGQSVACACPGGGSGAQVCNATGAFERCNCGSVVVVPRPQAKCSLASLVCSDVATNGQTGWKLHNVVHTARKSGQHREAICIAQNSTTSTDKVLAGASYYEMSYAWDALGCRSNAVAAIEESLRVRPSDKNGWTETCARCAELSGKCEACKTTRSQPQTVPCPQDLKALAVVIAPAVRKKTPADMKWEDPMVEACKAILLPKPGWYVIASVQQDSPDRLISLHLAVDASNAEVVAIGEAMQLSITNTCNLKSIGVENQPGRASTVKTRYQCMHSRSDDEYRAEYDATIAPPKILFRER